MSGDFIHTVPEDTSRHLVQITPQKQSRRFPHGSLYHSDRDTVKILCIPNPGPHLQTQLLGWLSTRPQPGAHPPPVQSQSRTSLWAHTGTRTRSPKDSTAGQGWRGGEGIRHTQLLGGPQLLGVCGWGKHACGHRPGPKDTATPAPKLMGTVSPTPSPAKVPQMPSSPPFPILLNHSPQSPWPLTSLSSASRSWGAGEISPSPKLPFQSQPRHPHSPSPAAAAPAFPSPHSQALILRSRPGLTRRAPRSSLANTHRLLPGAPAESARARRAPASQAPPTQAPPTALHAPPRLGPASHPPGPAPRLASRATRA